MLPVQVVAMPLHTAKVESQPASFLASKSSNSFFPLLAASVARAATA
jgi:hypothetical protein